MFTQCLMRKESEVNMFSIKIALFVCYVLLIDSTFSFIPSSLHVQESHRDVPLAFSLAS